MKLEDVVKKISKKFDSLEGRFSSLEGRFSSLEGRFDFLEGRFDSLEGQFDVVARMVLKNTGDISWIKDNMVVKEDLNKISQTVGKILRLHIKKDQEMTFMGSRVSRVENDVEKLKIVNEIV